MRRCSAVHATPAALFIIWVDSDSYSVRYQFLVWSLVSIQFSHRICFPHLFELVLSCVPFCVFLVVPFNPHHFTFHFCVACHTRTSRTFSCCILCICIYCVFFRILPRILRTHARICNQFIPFSMDIHSILVSVGPGLEQTDRQTGQTGGDR